MLAHEDLKIANNVHYQTWTHTYNAYCVISQLDAIYIDIKTYMYIIIIIIYMH